MAKKQVTRTDSEIRTDNYLSALTSNMRGRMDNYGAELARGGVMLTEPVLEYQYINNGFARLICDKPAEEMTRAGFTIVGLSDDLQQTIYSQLEELQAGKKLNEALKWSRAYGGGFVILGIKDGGVLTDPVNEESIQDIEFIRVYDRFEAIPSQRYKDPNEEKFGEVEIWQINPKVGGMMYYIHESRCLIFDGESIPNNVRQGNDGWGASVIQNCFIQLQRLESAYKWSLLLLERMQQAVHGIPGLSDQVTTPEGEKLVTQRVAVVDAVRNALNTIVIDAEESYEIKTLSLAGTNEIMDRFIRALAAVSSIPAYLIGENITGMNTGSSNKDGWYAQVEGWQNDKLRNPLDRLVSLLILANSDGATDGGDYTLEFNPLYMPSAQEQATINKTEADTLKVYCDLGVMEQDEARDVVADKYNLTGAAPEPAPEPDPVLDPIKLKPGEKLVPHPNAVPPKPVKQ